ncbi:hypothetical protein Plhal710r2_c011g0051581 [Plasmopara halstedii]
MKTSLEQIPVQTSGHAASVCQVRSSINNAYSSINSQVYEPVTKSKADIDMDSFCCPYPSFVTLASQMKMRVCELFWRRVHVHLISLIEVSSPQSKQNSAVLCIQRRRRHGGFGSCVIAISLDRSIHPVRLLPNSIRASRKLMIGIEYGWHPKHLWLRAPNSAVYEQWSTIFQAAFGGNGIEYDDELFEKRSETNSSSILKLATAVGVSSTDRKSHDSYTRYRSISYQSDIPDEEWTVEEKARFEG